MAAWLCSRPYCGTGCVSYAYRITPRECRTRRAVAGGLGQVGRSQHVKWYQRPGRRACVAAQAGTNSPVDQSLKETAALDMLIDTLLAATSQTELARQVSENVLSFDQKFWLRLATRSDTAASAQDKQRLVSLAECVMGLVDAIVKRTEQQQLTSQGVLEKVLRSAANEAGHWDWPLPQDKLDAMRQVMHESTDFDEAVLSQAYAWMRKVHDHDPGFVALLQKVLQLYAAKALDSGSLGGVDASLDRILQTDEAQWADAIQQMADAGVTKAAFLEALQKGMERTALSCAAGSYAQRVQAEFVVELEERARAVYDDLHQPEHA